MAGNSEWSVRDLKDCATWYSGGTPSRAVSNYWNGAIPWISAKSLVDFYVTDSDERVTEEGAQNGTRLVPKDTILFVVRGMSLKSEFRIGLTTREVTFNQDLKALVAKDGVYAPFLAYAIRAKTHEILQFVGEAGHGTGVLPTNQIQSLKIAVPSLPEQEKIARAAQVLDFKIDFNRRINQTLEAMAQAIFKSWFVDFDPVKAKIAAKAEGRDPLRAAMSAISGKAEDELDALSPEQYEQLAATAALFPDEMVESELGGIPAGWAASQVGKITSRVAMGPFGSDIKKENFVEAGVPVIRGGNLTNGLVERGYVFVTEEKANELKNANAFPDDIVVTHRGTLGQIGLIPQKSKFPRYIVSQSQMLLSVNAELMSSRYLFEFLRSESGKQLLLSNTSQVGVPAIARPTSSVKAIPLVVPNKAILDAYDKALNPLLANLSHTAYSSETLVELRDTLLPKLLSGELSVAEMD